MKFRKDINGLRALAVIAVVLFHFNSSWMPGGFAGVDVFFVISGFLMTGIIFRGMEQDNFSVLNFYVARANRIIPALALLCLALLFFGWFYLTPLEYKALGKHAASSVGFLSNFVYWREAGYFDAASHEKWLLHTWSLSVEWQFYIIYPLVLIALRKFLPIKTLKLLLIVGTVLGFIFSVVATYKSPNAAYYLFPTRAWEMMIGGVAYLYPFTLQENRKKLVEWVGLILVIASYFLISAENLWPGYLAIFPVLGSFLIIQAQRNDSIITGNIVFQKIGTWSYSIYLWHWPFVVAIYTFALPDYYIYIGMVLSVLLGFLSYKYVEKINFPRSFPTLLSYSKCKPVYIAIAVSLLSTLIFFKQGYNSNTEHLAKYIELSKKTNYCHIDGSVVKGNNLDELLGCYLGMESSEPVGLLWGDSYAGHLDPFIKNLLNKDDSFISRTASHCIPSTSLTISLGSLPDICKEMRVKTIKEIENHRYKVIFLAGRWEYMMSQDNGLGFKYLMEAVDLAAKNSEAVYIVSQPILYEKHVVNTFLRSKISKLYPLELVRQDRLPQIINKKLEATLKSKKYKNVYLIDRDIIYGSNKHLDYTEESVPYTYDDGHLTDAGSIAASKSFLKSDIHEPLKLILEENNP